MYKCFRFGYRMNIVFKNICLVYEYLYCEVSNKKWYRFKPINRDKKLITNLINRVGEDKIGDEWIFNYFLYQFSRYHDLDTKYGRGIVLLNWLTGQKAYDKWLNKSEQEVYMVQEFKVKYGLKNPLKIEVKIDKEIAKSYFDKERLRFFNTDRGLIHCMENELYNPNNFNCKMCKNKNICNG